AGSRNARAVERLHRSVLDRGRLGGRGTRRRRRARRAVTELVEHSLIDPPDVASADPRFRMLESTREFAASTLDDAERHRARARHATYFARRALELGARLGDAGWETAYPALVRDLDEIVAALSIAIVGGT